MVNILQCIHILNYPVVYLKLTRCSLSVVSLRLMRENKAKKEKSTADDSYFRYLEILL